MVFRKINLIFSISLLLIFLFYCSFAHDQKSVFRNKAASYASISGKVAPGSEVIDSIVIVFKTDYMFNTLDKYTSVKTQYPIKTGFFSFKFQIKNGAGKIAQVVIYSKSGTAFLREYLVEVHDNVFLTLSKKENNLNISFYGEGAAKYKCRREVELEYLRIYNQYVKLYSGDIITKYHRIDSLYLKWNQTLLKVLIPYQRTLTSIAKSVLKADAICQVPMNKESLFRIAFSDAESTFDRHKIATDYMANVKNDEIFDDRTYSLSYNIIDFLLQKVQTVLFFSEGGQTYSIAKAFAKIQNTYSGELRERMLMQLLINPRFKKDEMLEATEDYENSLHKAARIVTSKLIKNEISKKIGLISKGTKARDFALENRDGELVKLVDFKGKVVLLDVWYTGCSPCMLFSQRMERDVYPQFYGNENFEVASISIDKTRASWIKSVDEGNYTNNKNVNLFTAGLGSNHPFIQEYEIRGLPFLLIIDKNGNIFARLTNVMSNAEITTLIKKAILAD